jgi:hypothetical protein
MQVGNFDKARENHHLTKPTFTPPHAENLQYITHNMAGLSASRWAKKAAELKEANAASNTDKNNKTENSTTSAKSAASPSKNDRPVSSSTVSVFSEKDSSESDSDVDNSSTMSPAAMAFAARLSKPEPKKEEEPHTPTTSPRKTLGQSRWANKSDAKIDTKTDAKTETKIDPKDVPLISTPPKGPASEYKKNGSVSANDLRSRLAPPSARVAPFETVPDDVAKQQRRELRERERETYRQKKMGHTREWDESQTQPQHNGHNGHNGHSGHNNEPKERRNSRNGHVRRDSMNHHKPDHHSKLDARFEKKPKGRLPERQERPERQAPKKQAPTPAPAKTAASSKPKEPTAEEKEALRIKFEEHLKLSESKNFAWDDDEDDMWA